MALRSPAWVAPCGSCMPPGADAAWTRTSPGGDPSQNSMSGEGTIEAGRFSRCSRRLSTWLCPRAGGLARGVRRPSFVTGAGGRSH
eukprot:16452346-Heterocapsa_arctica.AAC.1